MARCLKCGAGNEWLEGKVPDLPYDEEIAKLRAEVVKLKSMLSKNEGRVKEIVDESLVRQRDAALLQLHDLQRAVEKFLYDSSYTPPWESTGDKWAILVQRLKMAWLKTKENVKSNDKRQEGHFCGSEDKGYKYRDYPSVACSLCH